MRVEEAFKELAYGLSKLENINSIPLIKENDKYSPSFFVTRGAFMPHKNRKNKPTNRKEFLNTILNRVDKVAKQPQ